MQVLILLSISTTLSEALVYTVTQYGGGICDLWNYNFLLLVFCPAYTVRMVYHVLNTLPYLPTEPRPGAIWESNCPDLGNG